MRLTILRQCGGQPEEHEAEAVYVVARTYRRYGDALLPTGEEILLPLDQFEFAPVAETGGSRHRRGGHGEPVAEPSPGKAR